MTTRPEISKKNKYWIDKHRHYELAHFCRQYPTWKKAYASLDSLSRRPDDLERLSSKGKISDPTGKCVVSRERFAEKMAIVERAAKEADPLLADYILKGVTEGLSYEYLKMRLNIPCCRDTYYDRYRKFFWILSRLRN